MRFTTALAALVAPIVASALDLRILTYNIRLATNRPGRNELRWDDRRPMLTEQLRIESNANTLMCFQEVFAHVVGDIKHDLGSRWSWVGKGRDDGKSKGEFSPIFYRNDVWDVDATNIYWLSKTPDKPSRSWDASQNRIVTVADLTHKSSGDKLTFMCTHFEWEGKEAQAKSAEIIHDLVDGYAGKHVFVAGDLNLEPTEAPYAVMTSGLTDFRTMAATPYADTMTYTGFVDSEPDMLIDYIFVKDPNTVKDPTYTVLSNVKDGKYISDHRPVVVDVEVLGAAESFTGELRKQNRLNRNE